MIINNTCRRGEPCCNETVRFLKRHSKYLLISCSTKHVTDLKFDSRGMATSMLQLHTVRETLRKCEAPAESNLWQQTHDECHHQMRRVLHKALLKSTRQSGPM